MAQVFPPSSNSIAKASIVGVVIFLGLVGAAASGIGWSPWQSGAFEAKDQPVPFSHEHHVRGLGIDCRYCHTSAEASHFAGIPATKTCMTCHSQVWTNANLLAPVRQSWNTNTPIQWNRVHNLPKFVYFNHSIHVAKGVGCASCHGEVNKMPLVWQVGSLQMEWCLNCHRNPEKFLRPREEIYNMDYDVSRDPNNSGKTQDQLGAELVQKYQIHKEQLTNCSVCHR